MIIAPDDFFTRGCGRCDKFDGPDCKALAWGEGLAALRAICTDLGLSETAKWGHPVYIYADRNLAIIGAFRDGYRLTFFNAGLMKDPERVLHKAGPNTQAAGVMHFTANGDMAAQESVIRAYLHEAIGYAAAGIKAPKKQAEFELPDEFIEALDADPELAKAFDNLTTGRQRSYVINLNGAKQSATRVNRIAKFRDKIIAGKGAQER